MKLGILMHRCEERKENNEKNKNINNHIINHISYNGFFFWSICTCTK